MHIKLVRQFDDLGALSNRWDELAGDCVFRSFTWASTWWKHYGLSSQGSHRELFILLVSEVTPCLSSNGFDSHSLEALSDQDVVAILPCYVERTVTRGKVLRFLADGEVASDYLDLLVSPDWAEVAVDALATYLCNHTECWDKADFSAINVTDSQVAGLIDALHKKGCYVERTVGPSCWSIKLPDAWDEFLEMQSKSHRKQLRRLQRRILDSNRTRWHLVRQPQQLDKAWDVLVDLHQRRRKSLGEPGCFASQLWSRFHRDLAQQLLLEGRLRLSWLELDGKPVAAEYHFASNRATYAYQGGVDPDLLHEEPGRLSTILTIEHAIGQQHQVFDFLRGNESYKAHWRATPQETVDFLVVPAHWSARWRHQAWSHLRQARRIGRTLTGLFG